MLSKHFGKNPFVLFGIILFMVCVCQSKNCDYRGWIEPYYNQTCENVSFFSVSCLTPSSQLNVYRLEGEIYKEISTCIGPCGFSDYTDEPRTYKVSVDVKSKISIFAYREIISSSHSLEINESTINLYIFVIILATIAICMFLTGVFVILHAIFRKKYHPVPIIIELDKI